MRKRFNKRSHKRGCGFLINQQNSHYKSIIIADGFLFPENKRKNMFCWWVKETGAVSFIIRQSKLLWKEVERGKRPSMWLTTFRKGYSLHESLAKGERCFTKGAWPHFCQLIKEPSISAAPHPLYILAPLNHAYRWSLKFKQQPQPCSSALPSFSVLYLTPGKTKQK